MLTSTLETKSVYFTLPLISFFIVVALCSGVSADTDDSPLADSTKPVVVNGLVVLANRISLPGLLVPSTVRVIEANAGTRKVPLIADVLGSTQGIRAYSMGNTWGATSVNVRGFYGGGQTDYLLATYDGIPVNRVSTGQVNWAGLPLASLARTELVLGPVSTQQGGMGFGGQVAMYSALPSTEPTLSVSVVGASDEAGALAGAISHTTASGVISAAGSLRRSQGWREHSELKSDILSVHAGFDINSRSTVTAIALFSRVNEQQPGALTQQELDSERTSHAKDLGGEPLRDFSESTDLLGGISGRFELGQAYELGARFYYSSSRTDRIQTVLEPVYSQPDLDGYGLEATLRWDESWNGRRITAAFGGGFNHTGLSSTHSQVRTGVDEPGRTISAGKGGRTETYGFLNVWSWLSSRIFASAGLRLDHIATSFDFKDALITSSADREEQSETAISPKASVGVVAGYNLIAYVSFSRAFRTPTLLHLYDSPPYPLPPEYGGGYTGLSNNELRSQYGICWEVGCKVERSSIARGRLSVYHYSIHDEIDFDMTTLSYQNIGTSRHIGCEAEWNPQIWEWLSGALSMSVARAQFRSGEHRGNQINGVPQFTWSGEIAVGRVDIHMVTLTVEGIGKQYLDGSNAQYLSHRTTVDLRAGASLFGVWLSADVKNLLDSEFSWDAYLGSVGESRYVVAPGRQIEVSVSVSL